jgi:hypothetical protein
MRAAIVASASRTAASIDETTGTINGTIFCDKDGSGIPKVEVVRVGSHRNSAARQTDTRNFAPVKMKQSAVLLRPLVPILSQNPCFLMHCHVSNYTFLSCRHAVRRGAGQRQGCSRLHCRDEFKPRPGIHSYHDKRWHIHKDRRQFWPAVRHHCRRRVRH